MLHLLCSNQATCSFWLDSSTYLSNRIVSYVQYKALKIESRRKRILVLPPGSSPAPGTAPSPPTAPRREGAFPSAVRTLPAAAGRRRSRPRRAADDEAAAQGASISGAAVELGPSCWSTRSGMMIVRSAKRARRANGAVRRRPDDAPRRSSSPDWLLHLRPGPLALGTGRRAGRRTRGRTMGKDGDAPHHLLVRRRQSEPEGRRAQPQAKGPQRPCTYDASCVCFSIPLAASASRSRGGDLSRSKKMYPDGA